MRWLSCALGLAAVALSSCGDAGARTPTQSYLHDPEYRAAELRASLVNPQNGYSSLRLSRYVSAWAALPEWNPTVAIVGAPGEDEPRALAIDESAREGDERALRALGEAAFFRYPVQIAPFADEAARSADVARRYGMWTDPQHGIGGLVRLVSGGASLPALTCATCHAEAREGALVVGLGSSRIDVGAMMADHNGDLSGEHAGVLRAWGPGRIDVSTQDGSEPAKIPDLRPVRHLTHLQHDGTVRQRSLVSLAIRIETLIVTSGGQTTRPPREIAAGLALYVWSLASGLPSREPSTAPERAGERLFAESCARCHAGDALTGSPVPIDVIGTDATLGRSRDRGTGAYRVPSLLGVSARGSLLHDGSVTSLESLLDPARASTVPGHTFGLGLDAESRAALVAYLRTR